MTPLKRPKMEKFAQAMAAGMGPSEAARAAGYPDGSQFVRNASKRAARADVKARIAELRAPGIARAQERITASIEWATDRLVEIANAQVDLNNVRAMDRVAALKRLSEMLGWDAPKKIAPTSPVGDGPARITVSWRETEPPPPPTAASVAEPAAAAVQWSGPDDESDPPTGWWK